MGRKRKKKAASINLDSFLDIMTCLVGVLVLIIILTSIDASQTKLLIPTPMAHETTKRPVFIECRGDLLYPIDLPEIRKKMDEELIRIEKETAGNKEQMIQMMSQAMIETDYYKVDLSYALAGQSLLIPKPEAVGLSLENINASTMSMTVLPGWLDALMKQLNAEEDIITFLVRDDSFRVFKKARGLAWLMNIEVSYELLDMNDPIKLGLGGEVSLAQ